MQKVKLGKTNLKITRWGLGGIPLSTIMSGNTEDVINQVIHAALDYGINIIDTARGYMDSETLIGEVMKERRSDCILASKTMSRNKDAAMEDIEESLRQLQTDKIELYQIHALKPHEVSTVMGKEGALQALRKAQVQGMIDYIGLTSHHIDVLIDLLKTVEFDTVMFPFNVIEREAETQLISLANAQDIGTIVMKPLAGGAIRNIDKAFRFFNNFPVNLFLNGVANIDEFNENISSAENRNPLTADELSSFEEEVSYLGKDFCRRCSYCEPCPNDIQIPFMIHLFWQTVQGKKYEELPVEKQDMGKNSMIWFEACEECGKCQEKCPYSLPTIQRKRELIALFSDR